MPNWQHYIRRLLDTENCQLYLTGSSAKLLSKEIATSLRGRALATEIFPFSFRERLQQENPKLNFSAYPGSRASVLLSNRMRKFLELGGFPEVQAVAEKYRIQILQEYVDVVILRDIIERHQVTNIQALRALVRQILATPATLFSVHKFYNDLRSQGVSCTKNSLYDYLDHLHDAYLVFPIAIYSRSERVRRTNPRKMYVLDTGLINAFSHQPQMNWGHALENFVYITLRRQGLQIAYYRTQQGTEVDFITISNRDELALYQVALTIDEQATYRREVNALETAMLECGLKIGYLITLEQRKTIKLKVGKIEVYPAWYWSAYGC